MFIMFGFALCCAGLIVPPILEVGICWHWDSACDNLHGCIGSSDINLHLTMMSSTDLNHRADGTEDFSVEDVRVI